MKNENINKQIMNKQEQFYAKLALKNHYLIKMNDIINIFFVQASVIIHTN